jgi:hypothetical protein
MARRVRRSWGRTLAFAATAWPFLAFAAAAEQTAQPARVVVPRLPAPPRLEDFAGMQAGGVGREMAHFEGFTARLPKDGEPLSQRTVVYLGYDDTSLYAVFVCFDSQPGGIRAHLYGRDRIPDADDSIALQLDTFRDFKHAYGFQANPLGVQQDGLWTEGKGWDLSFDTVWESDARLTAEGYVVLLRVPFRSLRFSRDDVQTWGLLTFRGVPRNSEEGFWPVYSKRVAGRMNQAAILEGLERVSPGRNAQVVPYASARSSRALEIDPAEGPRFRRERAAGDFGADLKLVVHGSLALDLTANPEFSQVESDEPQVTVNKRFETFFPEKRPFFLENASFFDTPIPLVFTRRIADPRLGARLTGRLGRYALGGLVAEDRRADGRSAFVGILRVNRDLGAESSLGVFASDRQEDGRHNRVAALDLRVKLARDWVGSAQAATSATREAEGREPAGPAYRATLQRTGRSLNYTADFNDRSAGFRSAVGFIERTGVRSLDQTLSWRRYPAGSSLLAWGPDLVASHVWDHAGGFLDRALTPKLALEWPRLTTLALYYQDARVRLRPEEQPSLPRREAFSQDRAGLEFATSFSRALTFTLKAATGRGVNLVPVEGAQAYAADAAEISATADIRPSPRLTLATSYLRNRLADPATGARIFTDQIARAKLTFQFTRAIAARAIVQYDRLAADPAATSLETRRRLNLDLLLTYLPSPGTAVYLGFNDDLQNFDPSLTLTPRGGLLRTPTGLRSDGWQVFLKASYLLRL